MELLLLIVGVIIGAWVAISLVRAQGSTSERLEDLARRQDEIERELYELSRRQDDVGHDLVRLGGLGTAGEQRVLRLEAAIGTLRTEVAELRTARAEAAIMPGKPPATSPAEPPAPTPAVASAAAPPPALEPIEAGPAPMAPAPTAPATGRPGAATPAVAGAIPGWRAPSGSPASAAAATPSMAEPGPETPPWATAPTPEPSGPGLLERALVAFGLTPTEGAAAPSREAVEAWLEGRMLAVVGGVALLLGAVFFLSLAFSRGWITEPMRVLIGLAAGGGLLVLGEVAFARLRGLVGPVLVAVGLAIISLALFASTRLYGLVAVEWALAGAFAAAVAAAAIAVRHDSQLVAAFGLIAVLAAPPLLGASPTIVTLLFVAATLVGTTGVALFRTWTWLPPLAFVLAAPQVASYVAGGPPVAEALAVVAGFWLVNLVAAGGEEFRHPSDALRTSTVTLLLADAAFTLWAGFITLDGPDAAWRGSFLAVGALLYLAIAIALLVRNGDRHPFGLIVAATGIAALTMAVPVQAGGPPVPIAWAAEAVALAWVAALRRHPYSAGLALLLGAMAIAHLVAFEYPPTDLVAGIGPDVPFVGPQGITFAFMLVALTVAGVGVPVAWIRVALATVGSLISLYVFPFELSGPALVAGWSALAAAGIVLHVRFVAPRIGPAFRERRVSALALPASIEREVGLAIEGLSAAVPPLFIGSALLAGVAALGHLVWFDYPVGSIVAGTPHAIPFVGLPGLSFAILLSAIAATGVLASVTWMRVSLTALGALVTLYVLPFELSGPDLVWAWSALATAAFAIEALVVGPRLARSLATPLFAWAVRPSIVAVGGLAGIAALGHLVAIDFPIAELGERILSTPPYLGPEGAALAGFLAALAASAWLLRGRWVLLGAAGIAAALLTYTVTFEVGQPAVTVAWAAMALVPVALVRRIALVPPLPAPGGPPLQLAGERLPYAAAALSLAFLVVRAYWLADLGAFAQHILGQAPLSGLPFTDETTFVLTMLAATIALVGVIWGGPMALVWGGLGAGAVIAWLLPFEVRIAYAVAGWCLLALAGVWAARLVPAARAVLGAASLGLAGFAAFVTLVVVAPPDRLVVDGSTVVSGFGPLTDATVALGALTIGLAAGAYLHRADRLATPALAAAGVAGVYLLSVAVVDWFQVQVGTQPLEDLQKSAQVGLSVLWSILGGATFAVGLATRRTSVRLFGLALLGLATVKVFLVDLAALDVAYRVLSLVALGVLLLVSAAVYSRIQHPHGPVSHHPA